MTKSDDDGLPVWFKTTFFALVLGGSTSIVIAVLYLIFRLISKI